jgi:hypothetical protein
MEDVVKKLAFLTFLCLAIIGCQKGSDPLEQVKMDRRNYPISALDWAPSSEGVLTFEFTIQNKASKLALQDLTLLAQGFAEDGSPIWSKTLTLDVSTLGKHATKRFTFQEKPERLSEMDAFQVVLAPDDESAPYRKYAEFLRAGS